VGRLRDGLYRALNIVPPSETRGLRLRGEAWQVDGNALSAPPFFRALTVLASEKQVLVVQGGAHPPEVRGFLERRSIQPEEQVAQGTVWPRASVFHLRGLPEDLRALAQLAEACATPEVADHLQLYEPGAVLLEWWDAFCGPIYISKRIPLAAIEAFSNEIERPYTELTHDLPPVWGE
jgi:hypothetical protein